MRAIHAADKIVNKIVQVVVICILSVMSCVVFAQVVFRMLGLSIPWSQELAQYLLVWCTFLGSALCIRRGALVGLEVLFHALPGKGEKALRVFVAVLSCALLIFLIRVGFWASARVWYERTAVLKAPMGLMYAAIPVGAVLMLFNLVVTTIYMWKGEK